MPIDVLGGAEGKTLSETQTQAPASTADPIWKASATVKLFRAIIALLGNIADEVCFKIVRGALLVRAVDPAHVAMVELVLPIGAFFDSHLEGAEEATFGVDVEKLKYAFKAPKAKDLASVEARNHGTNLLRLVVDGLTQTVALVDTSGMVDPKVPRLDFPARAAFDVAPFLAAVKACEQVSDHLRLIIHEGKLTVQAEGDTDKVHADIPCSAQGEGSTLFSLDYLHAMVKALKAAGVTEASLFLGNDYPLRLEASVGSTDGLVTYLLAPRIETS